MTPKPLSYRLAWAAVLLVALAAAGNWYLQPEAAVAWALAMFLLPIMWGAVTLLLRRQLRRSKNKAAHSFSVRSVSYGITFGSLMLLASLGAKLVATLGLIDDTTLSRRATMVISGAVLAFIGNTIPKMLTPLSVLQCDGTRVQAFQRLSGWTWVLAGLVYATVWIVLPVRLAGPVSMATIVIALLIVATQIVRLKWFRRRASPPTEA